MSRSRGGRRWAASGLVLMLHLLLVYFAWRFPKLIGLPWHELDPASAAYGSVAIGAAFGAVSMAVSLVIAVPAALVGVVTVVVLLAFSGKPPERLAVEARKVTKEMAGQMGIALLKEGNAAAAVFAVLGYFALVKKEEIRLLPRLSLRGL